MPEHTLVDLFVYGTLREGECNDLAVAAATHSLPAPIALGRGALPGTLVDFGAWPGMLAAQDVGVSSAAAAGMVRGEVYRIDVRLLPVVDAIEGYDASAPQRPSCFVRRVAAVAVVDGVRPCQFYPVDPAFAVGKPPIAGGDWVAYRRARDSQGMAARTLPDGASPSQTRRP
ncbi:gamma-glutamylcyclotransferase family protein [Chitinasiproducens palmae]|uniref:Uncharacterized conserved protein YtfP, gamma-glutamylcyclotransferase (GGCT)/AIG2-like family n=1 Tax=Chitinasiproducens palmae TaxID=1770053 RepID=A0A1H2PK42_9BURK|nr:gamma-glutamylcyclotransferase family protein [Chitinasiproducens palmae]SDV46713.1 Uncharacterized conserved protein YtfP, gamma-glutamylcyclotransferase (GGCT)/AIG2-like family [Chitinasiproducens palmae]